MRGERAENWGGGALDKGPGASAKRWTVEMPMSQGTRADVGFCIQTLAPFKILSFSTYTELLE